MNVLQNAPRPLTLDKKNILIIKVVVVKLNFLRS